MSPRQVSATRLRQSDAVLRALRQAGFSEHLTYHAFHILTSHVIGFTLYSPFRLTASLSRWPEVPGFPGRRLPRPRGAHPPAPGAGRAAARHIRVRARRDPDGSRACATRSEPRRGSERAGQALGVRPEAQASGRRGQGGRGCSRRACRRRRRVDRRAALPAHVPEGRVSCISVRSATPPPPSPATGVPSARRAASVARAHLWASASRRSASSSSRRQELHLSAAVERLRRHARHHGKLSGARVEQNRTRKVLVPHEATREAMCSTTCSASLPTPGRNPDDIA